MPAVEVSREKEWLRCDDPSLLLRWLLGWRQALDNPSPATEGGPDYRVSDRKLRLIACACWWRFDQRLPPPDGLLGYALRSVERWADDGRRPRPTVMRGDVRDYVFGHDDAFVAAAHTLDAIPDDRPAQAQVIRDVAGNPFQPAKFSRLLFASADVVDECNRLALAAYVKRLPAGLLDAARLSVLADALEDAGCRSAGLLEHLRSPGPHVRGSWALDLVLGKS